MSPAFHPTATVKKNIQMVEENIWFRVTKIAETLKVVCIVLRFLERLHVFEYDILTLLTCAWQQVEDGPTKVEEMIGHCVYSAESLDVDGSQEIFDLTM